MIYLKAFEVSFRFFIILFVINFFSLSGASAFDDCDKAPHFLWKGQFTSQKERALQFYIEAITLCPGFIRPYELAGNLYRKKGQHEKAIEFFTKAAELGTTNYKLYYLLADLLFQKGDLDDST